MNSLFADDKVVVQRFGDYCQAIYEGEGSDVSDNAELRDENVLYIHNSNRFGEKIARPLRSLCVEDNHLLLPFTRWEEILKKNISQTSNV